MRLRYKLRAASMVHPDASFIESPGNTFLAGRIAVLPNQVYVPARVRLAVVPRAIVRRAAHNRFASAILPLPLIFHPEISPASVVHPDSALVVSPRISLLARGAAGLFFQRHS